MDATPLDQLSNLQFRHQVINRRETVPSCLTFDYQYLPRGCAADIAENEAPAPAQPANLTIHNRSGKTDELKGIESGNPALCD